MTPNSFAVNGDTKSTKNGISALLQDCSIEVLPRTIVKIDRFADLLPVGRRVYIAHIAGSTIDEMVVTAARLRAEGYQPMPHIPARLVRDVATLKEWIARYQGEADVKQALLLGGGRRQPVGSFTDSMQLVETGVFDGFERLHFAGHPEGNRDIDNDGSDRQLMAALHWKQAFNERSDAAVALVTQFCFDPVPVVQWSQRLSQEGIDLPVHLGVAGPTKLQTLMKFALSCGIGPSVKVLQKRARDVRKLLLPYEPTEFLEALAVALRDHPSMPITQLHFFPLGGIAASANWICDHSQ
jgi:methylenetetrahydrofolate reductase (NADPH)